MAKLLKKYEKASVNSHERGNLAINSVYDKLLDLLPKEKNNLNKTDQFGLEH